MRDIHEAAYSGDVETVRSLLAEGIDPNTGSQNLNGRWVSCEFHPTPINCCLLAWNFGKQHLEVLRLLLASGARVRESHFRDLCCEAVGSQHDTAAWKLLRMYASHL